MSCTRITARLPLVLIPSPMSRPNFASSSSPSPTMSWRLSLSPITPAPVAALLICANLLSYFPRLSRALNNNTWNAMVALQKATHRTDQSYYCMNTNSLVHIQLTLGDNNCSNSVQHLFALLRELQLQLQLWRSSFRYWRCYQRLFLCQLHHCSTYHSFIYS